MHIRADILAMPWDLYELKPAYIAGVPDNFWVTCAATAELAHLQPDRAFTRFPVDGAPEQIAIVGDSIWFTMPLLGAVGRMSATDSTGAVTKFDLGTTPGYLVADENGATVATEAGPKTISTEGVVDVASTSPAPFTWPVTEFDDPKGKIRDALDGATVIADDGEGGCWFTEYDEDLVGHVDVNLTLKQYDITEYGMKPRGLLVDSEGFPWVVLTTGGVIGVIPEDPPAPQPIII